MKRSTAKMLQVIAGVITVILATFFAIKYQNKTLIYLPLAIYVPIAIWLNSKLRCPYCGAWPRKGHSFHQYCPKCGMPLDDE